MTPIIKKRLLRIGMIAALISIWLFFLVQTTSQLPWWFWLFPVPILLSVYQIVLRGSRCHSCHKDFALEPQSRTRGGAFGGGRVHMVCVFCGAEETHQTGPGP